MKINIATDVALDYEKVFEGFNLELFKALRPPLTGLEVERFDGCAPGDEVHLKIKTLGREQTWVSHITDFEHNSQEIYFIDRGHILPPPLAYWKHKHRIIKRTLDKSTIVDEIEFKTHSKILDSGLFPILYTQFRLRKPVYQKYFGK